LNLGQLDLGARSLQVSAKFMAVWPYCLFNLPSVCPANDLASKISTVRFVQIMSFPYFDGLIRLA
jgi:hypothetical protein